MSSRSRSYSSVTPGAWSQWSQQPVQYVQQWDNQWLGEQQLVEAAPVQQVQYVQQAAPVQVVQARPVRRQRVVQQVVVPAQRVETQLNNNWASSLEQAVVSAAQPIQVNSGEVITVNGQRGQWVNRDEVAAWRGPVALSEYPVNQDPSPIVINKKSPQQLQYVQNVNVRYLRPPTPPPPGEIIIKQQPNVLTPPAPPLVIRQQPQAPATPPPVILREAPPPPPPQVPRQVLTVPGKRLPAPPRKVVVERLPQLPQKPQSIFIDRWLPYREHQRRVIFERAPEVRPLPNPRNVLVQWEPLSAVVRREVRHQGVIRADPAQYVQQYGASLRSAAAIQQVAPVEVASNITLAANHRPNLVHRLVGDVHALALIDLHRAGLSQYASQVSSAPVQLQQQVQLVQAEPQQLIQLAPQQLVQQVAAPQLLENVVLSDELAQEEFQLAQPQQLTQSVAVVSSDWQNAGLWQDAAWTNTAQWSNGVTYSAAL